MSRKISSSRSSTPNTNKTGKTAKSGTGKSSGAASKSSGRRSSTGKATTKRDTSKATAAPQTSAKRASTSTKKTGPTATAASKKGDARPSAEVSLSAELLAKAEADIRAVIESLNQQMSTALNAMTELAVSQQKGHAGAVIRTAPLDRATATFQRLVAQVVDDQVGEMLPPLISLREEMAQRASQNGTSDPAEDDFLERGVAILDQVLSSVHVGAYQARMGEPFDPMIHLAVGETVREDLQEGAVAESLRPGFRTESGKVIVPAKVKVNRR